MKVHEGGEEETIQMEEMKEKEGLKGIKKKGGRVDGGKGEEIRGRREGERWRCEGRKEESRKKGRRKIGRKGQTEERNGGKEDEWIKLDRQKKLRRERRGEETM